MALSVEYLEEKLTKLNTKLKANKTKLAHTTRRAYRNRINRRIEGLEETIKLVERILQDSKNMIAFCE